MLRNKNMQLLALSQKLNVPCRNILYFDDDRNNVAQCASLGVTGHLAAPMTRAVWRYAGVPWAAAHLGRPLVVPELTKTDRVQTLS
eukprot:NODE_5370_length_582_cov_17.105066_g4657_i0.p2 GENE.NODE_5370_length_582_cov_17.105066_g4657_i0~~NODE_5370_length_582_cov_17.105066_g4657_i0.p2  ORF type:complete len:86 (-),score=21.01 NODE_5370_length_582_cov_17.105066_g4657_i0:15-272(-)